LGSGLFLAESSDLGNTGKAGRASESVIAVRTSGHAIERKNYSDKGTPVLIDIKTLKHVIHLNEKFADSSSPAI